MVKEGLPVYGCTASGYWCDVGDVGAYLHVHFDAMDGKIHLGSLSPAVEGALLEPGCILEAPVFIAPGAHIAAGARIGAYSVIGENCFIAPGASVKRSVLFPGARVEPGAQLRGCIVGTNAVIGEGAQLYEESTVGSSSRVGARAVLAPGVKLWPQKSLPEGERPDANIVWGSRREQRFVAGAFQLESPAQTARAAQSCVAEMKTGEVLIGRSASTVADAMWHAAASGAMAQGAQVVDAGICTLPQLRHALKALRADAALLVEEDRLTPLLASGARLPERTQRAILKLFERGDFSCPFTGITRPMQSAGATDASYVADVAAEFHADPACAPDIVLFSQDAQLLELAERAFTRAKLRVRSAWNADERIPEPGEIAIELCPGGEQVILSDEHSALTEVERQLACAWIALERGESRLILPLHATRAVEALAVRRGAHAVYLPGEHALWMAEAADKAPMQFAIHFDGLRFALAFLSALTERGMSLEQWRQTMPTAYRSAREVHVPAAESGRLLHALAEAAPGAEMGGGVRLPRDDGWAWLAPDDAGAGLHIMAESANMEAAQELCDFFGHELDRLMGKD